MLGRVDDHSNKIHPLPPRKKYARLAYFSTRNKWQNLLRRVGNQADERYVQASEKSLFSGVFGDSDRRLWHDRVGSPGPDCARSVLKLGIRERREHRSRADGRVRIRQDGR
jgi:hypothetical protein